MLKPDYNNSLVNLIASIESACGEPASFYPPLLGLPPADLGQARHIVLWLIDGLGYRYLKQHSTRLRPYLRGAIDSVFPTSTAPAITSLMTGRAPQQHAVTGWFMRLEELDAVTMILPYRARGVAGFAHRLPVGTLLGAEPVFSRLHCDSHIVINQELCDSDYSRATAGCAQRCGYIGLEECLDGIQGIIDSARERQFIYAYWPQFDHLAHVHGVASPIVAEHFRWLEQAIIELSEKLRGSDTQLIVTADHGFIDCSSDCMDDNIVLLNEHPELFDSLRYPLCGEPRAAYAYVRPERQRVVIDYLDAELSAELEWLPAAEMIAEGWFGQGLADARLAARCGDIVLLPKANRIVIDRLENEPPWSLIGVHGGLSEAELRVPLVLLEC